MVKELFLQLLPTKTGTFYIALNLHNLLVMVSHNSRKVLIYDEAGFSRVCSALLEISGCATYVMNEHLDAPNKLNSSDVGVFVTSYPYGAFMLDEVQKRSIPAIVLFDSLDEQFIDMLHAYDNLYCMIKPLDYKKFKSLVMQLLAGSQISRENYTNF
jgi:hypothetical protein